MAPRKAKTKAVSEAPSESTTTTTTTTGNALRRSTRGAISKNDEKPKATAAPKRKKPTTAKELEEDPVSTSEEEPKPKKAKPTPKSKAAPQKKAKEDDPVTTQDEAPKPKKAKPTPKPKPKAPAKPKPDPKPKAPPKAKAPSKAKAPPKPKVPPKVKAPAKPKVTPAPKAKIPEPAPTPAPEDTESDTHPDLRPPSSKQSPSQYSSSPSPSVTESASPLPPPKPKPKAKPKNTKKPESKPVEEEDTDTDTHPDFRMPPSAQPSLVSSSSDLNEDDDLFPPSQPIGAWRVPAMEEDSEDLEGDEGEEQREPTGAKNNSKGSAKRKSSPATEKTPATTEGRTGRKSKETSTKALPGKRRKKVVTPSPPPTTPSGKGDDSDESQGPEAGTEPEKKGKAADKGKARAAATEQAEEDVEYVQVEGTPEPEPNPMHNLHGEVSHLKKAVASLKSFQLAEGIHPATAAVASDIHETRARALREQLKAAVTAARAAPSDPIPWRVNNLHKSMEDSPTVSKTNMQFVIDQYLAGNELFCDLGRTSFIICKGGKFVQECGTIHDADLFIDANGGVFGADGVTAYWIEDPLIPPPEQRMASRATAVAVANNSSDGSFLTTDGIEISLRALDPLVTKRIVRFQKYVIDTGCTNHMGVKPGDMAYIDPFGRCPNIRETGILLADGRVVSAKAYPVQARLVDRSSLPKVPVSGFHWVWATTHPLQDRLCNPLEWRGLYMCSWPPARILTAPDRAWPLPMFEMAFGSVKGAVTALAPAGRGDITDQSIVYDGFSIPCSKLGVGYDPLMEIVFNKQ